MKKRFVLRLAPVMLIPMVVCGQSGAPSAPSSPSAPSAPSGGGEQDVYTLRMAMPSSDMNQFNFEGDFEERVSNATDGRVVIEFVDVDGLGGDAGALRDAALFHGQ